MYGWMIEADGTYWDGRACDRSAFTRDPNEGVRFLRFEDAERVKHWLLQNHSFALRTTQHAWVDEPDAIRARQEQGRGKP